ncbi:DUF2214 family protein [Arcobacter sp. LA11]|uniref:DUF2214 family protein n=1 Tax=Arcobacter sp. LA11 TaxID=1898176 RepID=UPI000932D82C|nr:DUF2214 family protein [Arcobacter sp. LA11]
MSEIIFRYIHFIGIMSLSATLVAEHLILSSQMNMKQFKKVAFIDLIFGISAIITLIGGLSLWLWVGKDSSFYSTNWIFHIKITIFILISLLSIYPTVFFLKNRNNSSEIIKIPKIITILIKIELLLLFILPFLGNLISRGYGID